MAASLSIRKVETKADFKTFLEFPWTLYKGDPYWTPMLPSMRRDHLDKKKNPTWKHLEGDYFVAWRGEQPVGTIAAFINHRYNEFHGEHIGFFGLFDVYDDQEAATALLETAVDYVRALGYDALRGPASFSTNDECALLIEGFDDEPVVLMAYNYPYYQRLIEATPGFTGVMDLYSYKFTMDGLQQSSDSVDTLLRVTQRNNERRKIEVKTLNLKDLKNEFLKLKRIYNNAWDKNWGFVPFSDEELDELVAGLGRFFEPRLAFFAEVDGRPVAFLLGIPDLNQALHAAYPHPGKPEIVSMLQVLWHWKLRSKLTRFRIMLMGVEEGYRNIGVEAAMFVKILDAAVAMGNWKYADGGWVLETNEAMSRLCDAFGGTLYRRYRFYERPLT
jgi:GNAT superfamily N-acetyltransferase